MPPRKNAAKDLYWKGKILVKELGSVSKSVPRPGLIRCDKVKKQLSVEFPSTNNSQSFPLSSISLPRYPPKKRTLSLSSKSGYEIICEFEESSMVPIVLDSLKEVLECCNSPVQKNDDQTKARRHLYSTSSQRSELSDTNNSLTDSPVSSGKERIDGPKVSPYFNSSRGWNRAAEGMEEMLRSSFGRSQSASKTRRQNESPSSRNPHSAATTPSSWQPISGTRSRRPALAESSSSPFRFDDEENRRAEQKENAVSAGRPTRDFYGNNNIGSGLTPCRRPLAERTSTNKRYPKRRGSSRLLPFVSSQFEDASDENEPRSWSAPQRSSTGMRRQISGVDDALLCQSPTKSPVKTKSDQQDSVAFSDNADESIRGGFANLGNSCYMNSILQAVFSFETFLKEVFKTREAINGDSLEMVKGGELLCALSTLGVRRLKASEDENRELLRAVKTAIKDDAMRFSGYHQEDAQEFLAQVLDQIKEESDTILRNELVDKEGELPSVRNPVTANFTFTLLHEIKCESCGSISARLEDGNDLPLQLAALESNYALRKRKKRLVSVQTLFDDCLKNEKVECRCEKCGSDSAEISHKFKKLPRCIIVYIKRYDYDLISSCGSKRADDVEIPLYLTLNGHCTSDVCSYADIPQNIKDLDLASLEIVNSEDAEVVGTKTVPPRSRLISDVEAEGSPSTSDVGGKTKSSFLSSFERAEEVSDCDSTTDLESSTRNSRDSLFSCRTSSMADETASSMQLKHPTVDKSASPAKGFAKLKSGNHPVVEDTNGKANQSSDGREREGSPGIVRDSQEPLETPLLASELKRSNKRKLEGMEDIVLPDVSQNHQQKYYTAAELSAMSEEEQLNLALEQSRNESEFCGYADSCSGIFDDVNEDDPYPLADLSPDRPEPKRSRFQRGDDEDSAREFVELSPVSCSRTYTDVNKLRNPSTPSGNNAETCGVDSNGNVLIDEVCSDAMKPSVASSDFLAEETVIDGREDSGDTGAGVTVHRVLSKFTEEARKGFEELNEGKPERTVVFKPINNEWRRKTCSLLSMKFKAGDEGSQNENEPSVMEMSVFDQPARVAQISGDGNCLFRALSYAITGGDENQHAILRQAIVSFESDHADAFRLMKGDSEEQWAAHLEKIICDATWGTDVELAACATMLSVDVWTFLDNAWICYRPRFTYNHQTGERTDIAMNSYKFGENYGIYLLNQECHFSPVIKASNAYLLAEKAYAERISLITENAETGTMKPSYRLLSVVSHCGGTSDAGHYVCDVWNQKKNSWYHCDDYKISAVSEDDVRHLRTSVGYIFFYIATELIEEADRKDCPGCDEH